LGGQGALLPREAWIWILVAQEVCLKVLGQGWRVCCQSTWVDRLRNGTFDDLRGILLGDSGERRRLILVMLTMMEESIVEVG
jgi:hypothetical protein